MPFLELVEVLLRTVAGAAETGRFSRLFAYISGVENRIRAAPEVGWRRNFRPPTCLNVSLSQRNLSRRAVIAKLIAWDSDLRRVIPPAKHFRFDDMPPPRL
jgi:hypothetical protein